MTGRPRRHNRGETCPDCGQIHERCLGHAKITNPERRAAAIAAGRTEPFACLGKPMAGQDVCQRHGGGAPHNRAAAERRLDRARVEGEAGQLLTELGATLHGRTTVDALDDMLTRAAAMVAALGILVAELDIDTPWTWDTITTGANVTHRVQLTGPTGLIGPNSRGEQKPNVLVELYGEWIDRYGRLAKAAGDLGLEARRVAITEHHAQAVVAAVLAGLRETGADTPEVRAAIATQLRALEPGT